MTQLVAESKKVFLSTSRKDAWWFEPLWTGFGFFCFIVYTTWATFQANYYSHESYLSPFYSPLLFVEPGMAGAASVKHAWFGLWPQWWPEFLPPSPAILILLGPLSFRMTCYYYRKFYYRSYFGSPTACAVTAFPQKDYKGETKVFLIQNIHRYTLYIAIFYIAILAYDVFVACFREGQFGIGVGTIIMLINVILLLCYTCGCHAFRHLVGGRLDCFSCSAGKEHLGHKAWQKVSLLNTHHMFWAWVSMIWVGFTDFYIRMVSMDVLTDFNTWGSGS